MLRPGDRIPGRIACIAFAGRPPPAAFGRELGLGIPLFGDPGGGTYEAFGLGRGSVRRVWLHPRVWASYGRLLARGQRPASTVRTSSSSAIAAELRAASERER